MGTCIIPCNCKVFPLIEHIGLCTYNFVLHLLLYWFQSFEFVFPVSSTCSSAVWVLRVELLSFCLYTDQLDIMLLIFAIFFSFAFFIMRTQIISALSCSLNIINSHGSSVTTFFHWIITPPIALQYCSISFHEYSNMYDYKRKLIKMKAPPFWGTIDLCNIKRTSMETAKHNFFLCNGASNRKVCSAKALPKKQSQTSRTGLCIFSHP